MRKRPILFGIHADPPAAVEWIPFIVVLVLYQVGSMVYLADNPDGKLLPSFYTMGERIWSFAVESDRLWLDTFVSLYRLGIGVILAAIVGLWLGVNMALFPGMRRILLSFIEDVSSIPPMGFIAIIMILAGIGDVSKILLIFLGIVFAITRDMYLETSGLAKELLDKACTIGASPVAYVYRIALPLVMPRLLETVRISLGSAWVYLIASESLSASAGLGRRMFVVARQMDMATIYPYLIWIGLLAFALDRSLVYARAYCYPWKE
jgi:NitT/TauT family transport system permease protein